MKKYPSIENHYQEKFIKSFEKKYPNILDELCIVQEKIDGFNFCVRFTKGNHEPLFYSRNQQTHANFQGANENGFMDYAVYHLAYIAALTLVGLDKEADIQFFGEVYGDKVQKRFNYGHTKWKVFDVMLNDELLPYDKLRFGYPALFNKLIETNLYDLPLYDEITFREALDDSFLNVKNLISLYSLKEEKAEGVVIKPQEEMFYKNFGDDVVKFFYLKKKRKAFSEKNKAKPQIEKEATAADRWNRVFQEYFNENRVKSVFSKEGEIQEKNEIGKYIKLVIQDMKEDFLKEEDIDLEEFDNKEKRTIFNMGSKIAQELMKYL